MPAAPWGVNEFTGPPNARNYLHPIRVAVRTCGFINPTTMNPTVVTSWQPSYVALSFVIATLGAFVALTAATRIRRGARGISVFNTVAAGLALGGIGVWSMHFVGMLALRMDVASSYSMPETLVSLVAAVAASSLALGYVARAPEQLSRVLLAGFLLGLGVVVMHYLGMVGMRFGGYIRWDLGIVALSAAIAIAAATAALWLAFHSVTLALRAVASVLMAVAVCAMHYTGMHAAEFICTTEARMALPAGFALVASGDLPSLVAVAALGMAAVISIDQLFQRALRATPSRTGMR
jgi:NO-binding membrane sensor protein with MHYT domain